MTKLTLEYLSLLETIRNNNLIANLRDKELVELIRNNRRLFKINLDKNTIQKAYNDELDSRERAKLEHQVKIDFDKLAETIRSNKAGEVNDRYASTVGAYSRGKIGAASIGVAAGIANQGLNPYNYEPSTNEALINNSDKLSKSKSKVIDWRQYASVSPKQVPKVVSELSESNSTNFKESKGGNLNDKVSSNQPSKEVFRYGDNQSSGSREISKDASSRKSSVRSSSNIIVSPSAKTSSGRSFGPGIS